MSTLSDTIAETGCRCCNPEDEPILVTNAPGKSTLDYRVSTYGRSLNRMKQAIAGETLTEGLSAGSRPLTELTTRSLDDPSIALLDACAVLIDILTFYQERIANEGFLRTSRERLSIRELARLVGYELRPGLAAETYLDFEIEPPSNGIAAFKIPVGTSVSNVPSGDELPVVFETVEEIEGRASLNSLEVDLRVTTRLVVTESGQIVPVHETPATPVFGSPTSEIRVAPDSVVAVGDTLLIAPSIGDTIAYAVVNGIPPASRNEYLATARVASIDREDARFVELTVESVVTLRRGPSLESSAFGLFVLGQESPLFGADAPRYSTLPSETQAAYVDWDQSGFSVFESSLSDGGSTESYRSVYGYDAFFPTDAAASTPAFLVLQTNASGSSSEVFAAWPISATTRRSLAEFTISRATTGVRLSNLDSPFTSPFGAVSSDFGLRSTVGVITTRALALVPRAPFGLLEATDRVTLANSKTDLEPGQRVILKGLSTDNTDVAEVLQIRELKTVRSRVEVVFDGPTTERYVVDGLQLSGNVAKANHGETSASVVGDTTGASGFTTYRLPQAPLTYTIAPTASGGTPAIDVRVNGVLWSEIDSLFFAGPDEEVYELRTNEDDTTTIIFGDGLRGARPPATVGGIAVTQRTGLGTDGELGPGRLTSLRTRPRGARRVNNPVPAVGASDPESLRNARRNAPLSVQTLDRLVALEDFEAFALAFGGIGQARAQSGILGGRQVVLLTVANTAGEPLSSTSPTRVALTEAIKRIKNPTTAVRVVGFKTVSFQVGAALRVSPGYTRTAVQERARHTLHEAFAFPTLTFGQPVSGAEVATILSSVSGVAAVNLTRLKRDGQSIRLNDEAEIALGTLGLRVRSTTSPAVTVLPAESARVLRGRIAEAELLTLAANAIEFQDLDGEA